jgi:predicted nuclease of restriction endonuclease-like (RecB) superfamily
VPTLSAQLTPEFEDGFSKRNLFRMIRFAEVLPDREIVVTLSRQLGWSHFIEIIRLDDELKRDFYAEMCRIERWSVRMLREKIGGMLFERTALSRKPKELIKKELTKLREGDVLTPDLVFRDPYFLDFLGLKDAYSENDLEAAILREMERFILELGVGFTFVARQKRIVIDGEDFYLDLLFYHLDGPAAEATPATQASRYVDRGPGAAGRPAPEQSRMGVRAEHGRVPAADGREDEKADSSAGFSPPPVENSGLTLELPSTPALECPPQSAPYRHRARPCHHRAGS